METQNYNPAEREPYWQKYWEEKGVYKFNAKTKKPIYSIDTPPPTVSGKMHMGHACSFTQADIIARYKRMKGFELFYPFGTDDNGLATERLIEKMKNVRSKSMDRAAFVKLCLDTLDEIRPDFVGDWKRVAVSADYSLFYSTINDHCRRISQRSFIDLYKMDRIYRKKAPVIFCPQCRTAIAQVEMKDSERMSTLNYIKAKTETGEYVIYATTRPELHPGCVGISLDQNGAYVTVEVDGKEQWIISKDAVEKFGKEHKLEVVKEFKGKELAGKKVFIPFAQAPVPLSHDESAKTEYGSGIVFYCTYGGLDCVEWMARHPQVKSVPIMDESGVYINGPYKEMATPEARKAILAELEKQGVLLKKEPLKHVVNVHERCNTDVEYIETTQWFVRYLDLREEYLQAGKELVWHPEHMRIRYDNWVKGLQWDWCISRQRYFGVPFPLWYCKKCGEVKLAEVKELPVDPIAAQPKTSCTKCTSNEFEPERDVFDTWATSSLTPQLAIELVEDKKVRQKLFPMSLRPQAHDIITFWLFHTLVKSQFHENKNPWNEVMISGFVLDPNGEKMSKSKGNVISPQTMIQKYCADALRFWAASTNLGEDMAFQEKELVAGQKFVTKLWNASKFCFMHLADYKWEKPKELEAFDRWLLSKLNALVKTCSDSMETYEYSKTKMAVEKFFWHTFCDDYLEICKDRIYNEKRGKDARLSAQFTLYNALLTIVKLAAPITPHITEEVYQQFFKAREKFESIHVAPWPNIEVKHIDTDIETLGDWGTSIIGAVRKYKSANKLSLKETLSTITLSSELPGFEEKIHDIEDDLKAVTGTKMITFGHDADIQCEGQAIKVGIKR